MIPFEDLQIEIYDPHKGGIRVGVPNGVKVTHVPTRTVAIVDNARSQHLNRAIAIEMIESALTHPKFRA